MQTASLPCRALAIVGPVKLTSKFGGGENRPSCKSCAVWDPSLRLRTRCAQDDEEFSSFLADAAPLGMTPRGNAPSAW